MSSRADRVDKESLRKVKGVRDRGCLFPFDVSFAFRIRRDNRNGTAVLLSKDGGRYIVEVGAVRLRDLIEFSHNRRTMLRYTKNEQWCDC
jgi:hypothetical protein